MKPIVAKCTGTSGTVTGIIRSVLYRTRIVLSLLFVLDCQTDPERPYSGKFSSKHSNWLQKNCSNFACKATPFNYYDFKHACAHKDSCLLGKREMSEDSASFTIEAMVRGYHVYRDVWHATMAEQLPCQREIGNVADPFAIAIVKSGAIVGHVPRRISSVCLVFLRKKWINCMSCNWI